MIFLNCASADDSVRRPAVAGKFYPGSADSLREEVKGYIDSGKKLEQNVQLLISPHAGYVFSGPVAGKGYATIDKKVTRVILIGPSHYEWFEGICLPDMESYQTPIGKVHIDKVVIEKLKENPLFHKVAGADEQEHCLEVQVPFLQTQLKSFTIVPLITGKVKASEVAEALLPFIDETTIVIASSDLSHYHDQHEARKIDDRTISTVLSGNLDGFLDACGERAIRIVMTIAKKLGHTPVLLDARTSYETAPDCGSKSRVVGYASIAFVKKNEKTTQLMNIEETNDENHAGGISPQVKEYLLSLARASLTCGVRDEKLVIPDNLPTVAKEPRGCFVTLTMNGQLRGCIGYIEPIKPLYEAVIDNARHAALKDPRFPAVTPDELASILVEVSVLTKPEVLLYTDSQDLLKKIRPDFDGIILQKGNYQSTFLPQVWEQLPDKITFLEHLSRKGGMATDGWKTANVKTYQAIHFEEK